MEPPGSDDDDVLQMADIVFDLENDPPSDDLGEVTACDIVTYLAWNHHGYRISPCDQTSDIPVSNPSLGCVDISSHMVAAQSEQSARGTSNTSDNTDGSPLLYQIFKARPSVECDNDSCHAHVHNASSAESRIEFASNLSGGAKPAGQDQTENYYLTTRVKQGSPCSYRCLIKVPALPLEAVSCTHAGADACSHTLTISKMELIENTLNALFQTPQLISFLKSPHTDTCTSDHEPMPINQSNEQSHQSSVQGQSCSHKPGVSMPDRDVNPSGSSTGRTDRNANPSGSSTGRSGCDVSTSKSSTNRYNLDTSTSEPCTGRSNDTDCPSEPSYDKSDSSSEYAKKRSYGGDFLDPPLKRLKVDHDIEAGSGGVSLCNIIQDMDDFSQHAANEELTKDTIRPHISECLNTADYSDDKYHANEIFHDIFDLEQFAELVKKAIKLFRNHGLANNSNVSSITGSKTNSDYFIESKCLNDGMGKGNAYQDSVPYLDDLEQRNLMKVCSSSVLKHVEAVEGSAYRHAVVLPSTSNDDYPGVDSYAANMDLSNVFTEEDCPTLTLESKFSDPGCSTTPNDDKPTATRVNPYPVSHFIDFGATGPIRNDETIKSLVTDAIETIEPVGDEVLEAVAASVGAAEIPCTRRGTFRSPLTSDTPKSTNEEKERLTKASGHLFLELAFPRCAGARVMDHFIDSQQESLSFVESGEAFRQIPAKGLWVPTGSKIEGLALHKGCGQLDSDIDNMYLYGGPWGVVVDESETCGWVEEKGGYDFPNESLNGNILESAHLSNTDNQSPHPIADPTHHVDRLENAHHHTGSRSPDPTSPPQSVSSPSCCDVCSVCCRISTESINSDQAKVFQEKREFVFNDCEPMSTNCNSVNYDENEAHVHMQNESDIDMSLHNTSHPGTSNGNLHWCGNVEHVKRGKIYIVSRGGDSSDSELENTDCEQGDWGEDYRLVLDKTACPSAHYRVRVEGSIPQLTRAMGQSWTPKGHVSKAKARKCIIESDGKHWLSSAKTLQVLLDIPSAYAEKIIQGPAGSMFDGQWDSVPGLICSGPSPDIHNFLYRPRSGPWPSQADLHRMANLPTLLVATGHKLSQHRDLEWRMSWSLHELLLAQHMPAWVKQGYWAFKYTVKRMLSGCEAQPGDEHPILSRLFKIIYKDSEDQGRSKLCSFHLKTTLLWELEDKDAWQDRCPYMLFLKLLQRLADYLHIGQLPHYFLEYCDLLECVEVADVKSALLSIQNIKANPLESLVRAPEFAMEVYGGPDCEEELALYKHSNELTTFCKLACNRGALSIVMELLRIQGSLDRMVGQPLPKEFLDEIVKKWEAMDAHRSKHNERLLTSDSHEGVFGREQPIVLAELIMGVCHEFFEVKS